ncbi:hypothetical protein [Paraclostridium sordellii]|uniref:hypothetical protein n=1 Tax=Paraclostridium sordellii TaxID=1505 RepID=UPI001A9A8F19|nr:hypothetical protein [Paeniclostridium sordellii]
MISPLDLEWDELLVYHQLYLRCDFSNMIVRYTDRQIEESLRKARIGRTRIKTILSKFRDSGLFVEISKGTRGKNSIPAIGKLIKIKEIEQTLIKPNINLNQTNKNIENSDIEGGCKPNTNPNQPLFNPLIKEKGIKNNIYSASSEALWKLYPNKQNKARAMKEIPKLISKYGYEQIEQCIKRYIDYVEEERRNGFKSLKYQAGSTFFNGTYVDYLDENFQEKSKKQQSNSLEEFKGIKLV